MAKKKSEKPVKGKPAEGEVIEEDRLDGVAGGLIRPDYEP
jgi:hypothetical protein